jgi:pyrroloquinoline quinone biosynthesis protein B
MRVKVLGSAAGGGFPQWNCGCQNCQRFRAGKFRGRARTQTQLAFTTNSKDWFLLGASPDLRTQLVASPEFFVEVAPGAPSSHAKPGSPVAGVFLPSADVDSVAGLLHLREFETFFVFATSAVQQILQKENSMFRVLQRADPPVNWVTLSSKSRLGCHLQQDPGAAPEFFCATIPLGVVYPDYVSEALARALPPDESSSGFVLQRGSTKVFFAPSISAKSEAWRFWVENSDVSFLDGTFWSDHELIATGRSKKTAREIGHLPLSGEGGLLETCPSSGQGRRILIHINNTNPILDENSPEHRAVLEAGFEVAYDGMDVQL